MNRLKMGMLLLAAPLLTVLLVTGCGSTPATPSTSTSASSQSLGQGPALTNPKEVVASPAWKALDIIFIHTKPNSIVKEVESLTGYPEYVGKSSYPGHVRITRGPNGTHYIDWTLRSRLSGPFWGRDQQVTFQFQVSAHNHRVRGVNAQGSAIVSY